MAEAITVKELMAQLCMARQRYQDLEMLIMQWVCSAQESGAHALAARMLAALQPAASSASAAAVLPEVRQRASSLPRAFAPLTEEPQHNPNNSQGAHTEPTQNNIPNDIRGIAERKATDNAQVVIAKVMGLFASAHAGPNAQKCIRLLDEAAGELVSQNRPRNEGAAHALLKVMEAKSFAQPGPLKDSMNSVVHFVRDVVVWRVLTLVDPSDRDSFKSELCRAFNVVELPDDLEAQLLLSHRKTVSKIMKSFESNTQVGTARRGAPRPKRRRPVSRSRAQRPQGWRLQPQQGQQMEYHQTGYQTEYHQTDYQQTDYHTVYYQHEQGPLEPTYVQPGAPPSERVWGSALFCPVDAHEHI